MAPEHPKPSDFTGPAMSTAGADRIAPRPGACPFGDIVRQRNSLPAKASAPYGESMNKDHLEFCASEEWREMLRDRVLPYALAGARLGEDVLEVGAGPGLTTDLLRVEIPKLTAVELDDQLAASLTARLAGTNVDVVHADATSLPFDDERFTGAVSFTMLHHVPSAELQDRLFAEVARVLRRDGVFVASDSVASEELAAFHEGDVYNPIDPTTVEVRLDAAGFGTVRVQSDELGWTAHAMR